MNIVLLSGGSGKRLWPLSNDTLSKQFLKLLKNNQGEYESMVQRVMRQLTTAYPDAAFFVSSNLAQNDILQKQLGAVKTILEPTRRNTFPAIVLAAAHLHYQNQLDEDTSFIVCPIDVFAESKYFECLKDVENLASSGQYAIGLLGAIPTYPSEKYGYILQENGTVAGFIEKPSALEAERLIIKKALWNCGVFALKIGYVLQHAKKYITFENFESLYEQYAQLPQISFDYEVVEKESSIGAIVYDGVWKDLGTWNTLTEEMSNTAISRHVLISENCNNTHVLNMLDIPIITQDIQDAVVIASHDGILVSSKHGSSFLKPLADQISLRPMYEQRRWGNYRVLEYKQADTSSSMVKRVRIDAGQTINVQYHAEQGVIWVIISGKGILTIQEADSVVSPGNTVKIQPGISHSLLAATTIELIEVQLGAGELGETFF